MNMASSRILSLSAIVAFSAFLVGCQKDAKKAWTEVLAKCAISDLNGPTILYFGPSNGVGPGAVWRKADDNSYRLRFPLNDFNNPKNLIQTGRDFACDGSSSTKFSASASVGLTTSLAPVSADVANDFKKATDIQVNASSAAWDLVKEGEYENYVRNLAASDKVKADLMRGDRLVLYRALRVSGYKAVLTFSDSDAASIKAKYSGPLMGGTGDVGVGLSASMSSENKLTLTAAGDFYIAGELVSYKVDGFAATKGSPFGIPQGVLPENPVVREK